MKFTKFSQTLTGYILALAGLGIIFVPMFLLKENVSVSQLLVGLGLVIFGMFFANRNITIAALREFSRDFKLPFQKGGKK